LSDLGDVPRRSQGESHPSPEIGRTALAEVLGADWSVSSDLIQSPKNAIDSTGQPRSNFKGKSSGSLGNVPSQRLKKRRISSIDSTDAREVILNTEPNSFDGYQEQPSDVAFSPGPMSDSNNPPNEADQSPSNSQESRLEVKTLTTTFESSEPLEKVDASPSNPLPSAADSNTQSPIHILDAPSCRDDNVMKRDAVRILKGSERLNDSAVNISLQYEWRRSNGAIAVLDSFELVSHT
jgi:hypothetical protein